MPFLRRCWFCGICILHPAQDWLCGSVAVSREGTSSCDRKHPPGLASVCLIRPQLRGPGETWVGLALKVQRWLVGDRHPVCACDAHLCLQSQAAPCPRLHVGSLSPENLSMGTGPCPHRLTSPGSWPLFRAVQTGSESDPVTCLVGGGGVVPAATSSQETCPQARVLALVLRLLWEQASPDFLSVVFDSFFRFTCFTFMQVTYLPVHQSRYQIPHLSHAALLLRTSVTLNRLLRGPQTTLKFGDSLEGLAGLSQAVVVTLVTERGHR